MPCFAQWLLEDHTIEVIATGTVAAEEIAAMSQNIVRMYEGSPAAGISIIIDETEMDSLPTNIAAVLKSADFLRHPKVDWFIMVGDKNRVIQLISNAVAQLIGIKRFRRFSTKQEATQFLNDMENI